MARRSETPETPIVENIIDVDVSHEMQNSFLEYAYSVIYSRALPDARDGLKPVQRRILYTMHEMGLRPEKGHVKSARVVGEVMGKLHPHGDSAIYDAMVRMAQHWSFRLPLVDGHGNFGSLDDGPAAYRYTEARLAQSAMAMTESLDEDVVDMVPNYDGREVEPDVLPSAIPALLVNGAAGIAVGMATNIPPHNLNEVVAAARHLLKNPKATVADLMNHLPGPDLPGGGIVVGLDGIRDAYVEGRGSFKIRASAKIENVTARKQALVITELPYNVGPERVIEKIKDGVNSKKLQGISDVADLSDGDKGLQLVIELKTGVNPQAVLESLYKHTPLEDQFSINAVALVGGRPQTLGIKEMLQVFLDHRIEVIRRRSEFRLKKAEDRLHLVAGLLVAIIDIDKVIKVIRSSDDTAAAREKLMSTFKLSEIQTNYILEMPLRRLTKFSKIELETEESELKKTIASLKKILSSQSAINSLVSDELAAVAKAHGTARRTVLQEADESAVVAHDFEISDDPTVVMLSTNGLLARFTTDAKPNVGSRSKNDLIISTFLTTARAEIGVLTNHGRVHRVNVVEIPALAANSSGLSLKGGGALKEFILLEKNEAAVGIVPIQGESIVALGTRNGIVKRVSPSEPPKSATWDLIKLEAKDEVIGVGVTTKSADKLVFITSNAQLLKFDAEKVRPQGRNAGGMAGINLDKNAHAIGFYVATEEAFVATISESSTSLPGTETGSLKITKLSEYPVKGRATGGVRCHAFRKGEDQLRIGFVGEGEPRAIASGGSPIELDIEFSKRDATGVTQSAAIGAIAGQFSHE
jgi:DNA gyrase subunit A